MKVNYFNLAVAVLLLCFGVSAELLILQVGGATDGGLQRSFVELYNNSDNPVDLDGYSLQYAAGKKIQAAAPDDDWQKIDLTGTILPEHSFLILGDENGPNVANQVLKFENTDFGDMYVPGFIISNRSFKVALIGNTDLLDIENPFDIDGNGKKADGYIDMLGACNDGTDNINGFETNFKLGFNKHSGVRRISLTDTDNNSADFTAVDYRNISQDLKELYSPKNISFGAWNPFEGLETELPFKPSEAIVPKNGLPVIEIWTHDESAVTSKDVFKNLKYFSLTDPNEPKNDFVRNSLSSIDEIRGRGNSTWGQPKKPYRIRFREDISFFGLPARRNWVLLADHFDPTLLKNSIAFELGKRLELEYTCSYNHVEFYLNGVYQGKYLLTEHRQADPNGIGAPGRPKVDFQEGWFVELDWHYDENPKFRTTNYNLPVLIKTPEESTVDINLPIYDIVKNDWHELDRLMASTDFPENGYRDLIDMETIAKFLLVPIFAANNADFIRDQMGSVFFYKDKDGFISGGPLWDFDLSFGTDWVNMAVNTKKPNNSGRFYSPYPTTKFFGRFFQDPKFRVMYKEIWNNYFPEISSMPQFIEDSADKIRQSAKENHEKWRPNVDFDFYAEDIKDFVDVRIAFLDSVYNLVDVLPTSKNFGTALENYTEISSQIFTLVAFDEIEELEMNLQNADLSDFEILADIEEEPTGNGGYLATVNVKPKNALSLNSLPTKTYSDLLILSGKNQGNDFTLEVSLSFTLNCNHSYGELEITLEATCETDGEKARVCSICGEKTDIEAITKSGHTWVNATYENPKTCSVCEITEGEKLKLPTSIGKKEKSGRFGIKFTQNPTADNAEILVNVECGIRNVELKIYDMTGNVVFDRRGVLHTPANNAIVWDLRNNAGRKVANGTYLVVAEIIGTNGKRYSYSAKLGVKR